MRNKRAQKPMDIEAMAAKAKLARQEKCSVAINEVLKQHRCQMSVVVNIGGQAIPLGQIFSLPIQIQVVSQE